MDWAEELKMSIRKKTARKGRRSKSKDPKEMLPAAATSTTAKEMSIDITLDMQPGTSSSSTAIPPSTTSLDSADAGKRPPMRRISGGWADAGGFKISKSKKSSFDDERFNFLLPRTECSSPLDDNIPTIPDMEDLKDEDTVNDFNETPAFEAQSLTGLTELSNKHFLSQQVFAAVEGADLSILAHCLRAPEELDEADYVWDWHKVFTELVAEINMENEKIKATKAALEERRKTLKPDEVPPPPWQP